MTKRELRELRPGDVVRSLATGYGYIVTANYGDRATAVRTVDITNAAEWEIVTSPAPEQEHKP